MPLTLRSMLSSQVSLVFEGLSARGRSTMHVGPCSPLANEEKSSQEDRAEVFMLTSYTSHTSLLPCLSKYFLPRVILMVGLVTISAEQMLVGARAWGPPVVSKLPMPEKGPRVVAGAPGKLS